MSPSRKRTGPAFPARPARGTTAAKRTVRREGTTERVYALAAPVYFTHPSGLWKNVIPVVPGDRKRPAVAGHHGGSARAVTGLDLQEWIYRYGSYNIGVVLPDGIIGIDVDCYDGKVGAQTLADLEAELGSLPPTYTVTSRTDGSGIRLFQTVEGVRWPGEVGKHVELIWMGNRFVMMPPSLHHTRRQYALLDPDGAFCEPNFLPALADLPLLSDAWVSWLQDKASAASASVYEGRGGVDTNGLATSEGLTAQLVQLCRQVLEAAPGNRNNLLHWAACRAAEARRHGMPEAAARDALALAAERAGLDRPSIHATLNSAFGRTHK